MHENKQDRDRLDNYLEDLREWNDHQYDPGYWVQGRVPPQIKYGGRGMGVVFLASGLTTVCGILFAFFHGPSLSEIIALIIPLIIGGIFIWAGLRRILTGKRRQG